VNHDYGVDPMADQHPNANVIVYGGEIFAASSLFQEMKEVNWMADKDRVIEGKEERQKTMDKLSIESGEANTYDPNQGSGCLHNAKEAREKRQEQLDR